VTSILVQAAPQRRATGITVVGIPARNEAATVASVAVAADAGLQQAFPAGGNVIVLAENGSTDDTVDRFMAAGVRSRRFAVRSDGIGTGKGTNIFAIIDKALELDADRVVLLDADVRSATADWVGLLADAVDTALPAMAVPVYQRNRYEANTTNQLASPLLAALFGTHVEQPIGGEFAVNRAFMEASVEWRRSDSAYLYGIDVWLTGNALRNGHRVAQVPLGRKLHNSPFPKILSLPLQVLDSLLHVAVQVGRPCAVSTEPVPQRTAVDGTAVRQDPAIIASVTRSVRGYLDKNMGAVRELFPTARALPAAPWGLRVATEEWPSLLAEGLAAVAAGCFEPARDHLIGLYVNRVLSFWDEIEGLDEAGVNALLDRQAADTVAQVAARSIDFTGAGLLPAGFHRGHWADIC
jgi:hypothetical protein